MAWHQCFICSASSQGLEGSLPRLRSVYENGEDEDQLPIPIAFKMSSAAETYGNETPYLSLFQLLNLERCGSCNRVSSEIPNPEWESQGLEDELRTSEFCSACTSELDQFHKLLNQLETLETQICNIRDNVRTKMRTRLSEQQEPVIGKRCPKIIKRFPESSTRTNKVFKETSKQSVVVKVEIEPHEEGMIPVLARRIPLVKLVRLDEDSSSNKSLLSHKNYNRNSDTVSTDGLPAPELIDQQAWAKIQIREFTCEARKPPYRPEHVEVNAEDSAYSPYMRDFEDEHNFTPVEHLCLQSNPKGWKRRKLNAPAKGKELKRKAISVPVPIKELKDTEQIGTQLTDFCLGDGETEIPGENYIETPENFLCNQCGASFPQKGALYHHIRAAHCKAKPICDLCGQQFYNLQGLAGHQFTHHSKELNLSGFKCDQCEKVLASSSSLHHHIRTVHEKKYRFECTYEGCDFKAFHMAKLRVHLQTHTNEKNHVCAVCGESFRRLYNFNVHMRKHTGEKPFVCGECGKAYNRKDKLQLHEKKHKPDRPHVCELCGMKYPTRSNLVGHIRSHHIGKSVGAGIRPKRKSKYEDLDPTESQIPPIDNKLSLNIIH